MPEGTIQNVTIDGLPNITDLNSVDIENDVLSIRTGNPPDSPRTSNKITIKQLRDKIFNSFAAGVSVFLQNLTATAEEVNVLSGIDSGVTTERLNYLAGATPGESAPNRVAVYGDDRGLGVVRVSELRLRNEVEQINATAEELNRLHNVPNGLTRDDLGKIPTLLSLFLDPSPTLVVPDFTNVADGDDFEITVGNLKNMRGTFVPESSVNVRLVIGGTSLEGGVREEENDSLGSTTFTFTRGASTDNTHVQISSGDNSYVLELTYRGIKYRLNGIFRGDTTTASPPALDY